MCKVHAHGAELKDIAAGVAGVTLQMAVTVPLVVQTSMNAF